MNKKLILGIAIMMLILTLAAAAQNDPGHDTLYIEEEGDSILNGTFNVTDNQSVDGGELALGTLFKLRSDGQFPDGNMNYIVSEATGALSLNSVGGNSTLKLQNDLGGAGLVQVGKSGSSTVDLNVSGDSYILGNVLAVDTNFQARTDGSTSGSNINTIIVNGTGANRQMWLNSKNIILAEDFGSGTVYLGRNSTDTIDLNVSGDSFLRGNKVEIGPILQIRTDGTTPQTNIHSIVVNGTGANREMWLNSKNIILAENMGTGTVYIGRNTSDTIDLNVSGEAHVNGSQICTPANGLCGSSDSNITGGGTSGTIPKWTANDTIGDSIITESGSTITISGNLGLNTGTTVNEISTDTSLTDSSDNTIPTENAVKTYVDNNAGGNQWNITGAKYLYNNTGNLNINETQLNQTIDARDDTGTGSLWTNSSNNATYTAGNVGIGTTSPRNDLHIESDTTPTDDNTIAEAPFLITDGNGQNRSWITNAGTQKWQLANGAGTEIGRIEYATPQDTPGIVIKTGFPGSLANRFDLRNNKSYFSMGYDNGNAKTLNIDDSGQVGIGTTSPTSLLQVNGKIDVDGDADLGSSGTLFVDSSAGEVGIGLTTPSMTLHVSSGDSGETADSAGTFMVENNNDAVIQLATGRDTGQSWTLRAGQGAGTSNEQRMFRLYDNKNTEDRLDIVPSGPFRFLNGDVGIGTKSPGTKLEVNGTIRTNLGECTEALETNSNGDITCGTDETGGGSLWTNSSNNATYTAGNVGIGTTSPSEKLEVNGDGAFTETSFDSSGSFAGYLISEGSTVQAKMQAIGSTFGTTSRQNDFEMETQNGGDLVLQRTGGQVGIGTASPGVPLDVQSSGSFAIRAINGGYRAISEPSGATRRANLVASNSSAIHPYLWFQDNDAGNDQRFTMWADDSNQYIGFAASGEIGSWSPDMVLENGGNVGIGTTSPGQKLEVVGGSGGEGIILRDSGDTTNIGVFAHDGSDNSRLILRNSTGDTNVFLESSGNSYFTGGNVGIGNTLSASFTNEGSYNTKTRIGDDETTSNNAAGLQLGGYTSSQTGELAAIEFFNVRADDIAAKIVGRRDGDSNNLDAGAIEFYTSQSNTLSERMVIDTSGNVGIDDTTPSTTLDLGGQFRVQNQNAPSTGKGLELAFNPTTNLSDIFSYNRDTGTFQELRIRGSPTYFTNGNVGIGTSGPNRQLDIAGHSVLRGLDSDSSYALYFGDTGNQDGEMWIQHNGGLDFGETGTGTHMTIDEGGNVGIGDTNPNQMLEVNGSSIEDGIIVTHDNSNARAWRLQSGISGTDHAHFAISDSGTERLSITETGLVGIGTPNPANQLDVNGGIDANTLNTGQGDNELYAMNQNVRTSDNVDFNQVTLGSSETALIFDNGADRITVHDGFGNFNILSGIDHNNNIVGSTGGGTRIEMSEGGYVDIEIYDSNANEVQSLEVDQNGATLNGNQITTENIDSTVDGCNGCLDIGTEVTDTGGLSDGDDNTQLDDEAATSNVDIGGNNIIMNGQGYITFQNNDGNYHLGGGNTPDAATTGIHLETATNPSAGSPIFVVESSGGSERLRVEHSGTTSTTNTFDATGYTESGSNTLSNDISGDADTLDGNHASAFMDAGTDNWVNEGGDTMTGALNFNVNNQNLGQVIDMNNVADSDWALEFRTNSVGNDNPSGFWVNSDGTPDMRLRSTGGTVTALIHSNGNSYINGGNLAVGHTSPGRQLDVQGTIQTSDGTDQGEVEFRSDRGDCRIFESGHVLQAECATGIQLDADSNNNGNGNGIEFYKAGTQIGNIDLNGNLQIDGDATIDGGDVTLSGTSSNQVNFGSTGVTAPTSDSGWKLKLYEGADLSSTYGFGIDSSTLWSHSSSRHEWWSSGTERMSLDSSGNLQTDGDYTVGGNDIKDSSSTNRITFSSGDVIVTVG